MISRIYYTLSELLNHDVYIINYNDNEYGVEDIVGDLLDVADLPVSSSISMKLMAHIWANISMKDVLYVDICHPRWKHVDKEDVDPDELDKEKKLLGQAMWSLYIDTKDRYERLINIYNDELDDLMLPVTTITDGDGETRFNDTPQNFPNAEGYAEDNYTTNVTKAKNKVTVSNDLTSKMNRINEVQTMLRNLYADWAFEFNKLIVGE